MSSPESTPIRSDSVSRPNAASAAKPRRLASSAGGHRQPIFLGQEPRVDRLRRGMVGERDAGGGPHRRLPPSGLEEVLNRREIAGKTIQQRLLDHRQAQFGRHRFALRIGRR